MTKLTGKYQCAICDAQRGIFKCNGCSAMFCAMHTMEHHQGIVRGLVDVEEMRDSVQKALMEEPNKPQADVKSLCDELTKTINDWEQESVDKIHQVAEEIRQEVIQNTTGRLSKIQLELQRVSDELQQSRQNQDCIESDLAAWKDQLIQLKEELINPPAIVVREDYTKFIPNIRVSALRTREVFDCSSGNADFEENGQVVYLNTGLDIYTEVRGRCGYIRGQHTITMKVEELNGWILFGIISQSTPIQIHSYLSPSCYGWYNGWDFNYAAGQHIGGRGNDVAQDDIVHLFIDCDEHLIRLTNERVNQTEELKIDIEKCPFPWKLHLNLNMAPTRIRILSSSEL